ncbi:hypothetical protein J7E50_18220 [Pedobacter sp. ISL-68]|uniref:hypothetical protein n=1 Tax=unclassified Pedobacter TaxID=2628915 RepID=UPI001BE67BD4|nr:MULTISPECIES: hypothetical protein [unclassified Pedobacter]MBT2559859.1 hypothetical protein [Pedobacter sp. ISL-64]MBT2592164.1 hypothetical protein [Pedobacter sp. ISL-68]
MENKKNNAFADWLFNQFVEKERKYGKSVSHRYLLIFSNYVELGFDYQCPKMAEQNARITLSSIDYAVFNWKTHLLDLKGKEGRQEQRQRMKAYKERLKAFGYSQDEIANLLIEKYMLNNPKEEISPDKLI